MIKPLTPPQKNTTTTTTRDKLVAVQGRFHSDYRAFEAIEGVFEGGAGPAHVAAGSVIIRHLDWLI